MPLARNSAAKKPKRQPHEVTPIVGEHGRYVVNSRSAAEQGKDEAYICDIFAVEETAVGTITGTCPCDGWRYRKTCTHLDDARAKHVELMAEAMGFTKYD